MPKRKPQNTKEYLQIRSLVYFIGKALEVIRGMSPDLQAMLGTIIEDSNLSQIKDLATLEQALKKISFR